MTKLLHQEEYMGRQLYLLEYQGKCIKCYKSSGLSGTGHKGQVLPFSGLNDSMSKYVTPGYIYKEMYYGGVWVNHRKNPPIEIIQFLGNATKDIEDLPESYTFEGIEGFLEHVKGINQRLNLNMEPYDLKEL